MKLDKAKMQFIQTWGSLGSAWGIPRSMAQIHALLLVEKDGLSTEEVMDKVQLSRGNVNINLRELINWRLVSKENRLGERKEFFLADHNIWNVAKNIIQERKKREVEPIQNLLSTLQQVDVTGPEEDVKHFQQMIDDLSEFVQQMDQLTQMMNKLNNNKFYQRMMKLIN